tara:strand:- start:3 stop:692 length:690 start_codon:yes stop_codon:yes gene_type:complete
MLATKDFLFVHVPKTGGMSLTNYFISNFSGNEIWVTSKNINHTKRLAEKYNLQKELKHFQGRRHGDLDYSLQIYESIFDRQPDEIFTIIREPSELLFSYFMHIQKERVINRRGLDKNDLPNFIKVAKNYGFKEFVSKYKFYKMDDDDLLKFYQHTSKIRISIIPLEYLSRYINLRFPKNENKLKKINSTKYSKRDSISNEAAEIIYIKYKKYNELYLKILSEFKSNYGG